MIPLNRGMQRSQICGNRKNGGCQGFRGRGKWGVLIPNQSSPPTPLRLLLKRLPVNYCRRRDSCTGPISAHNILVASYLEHCLWALPPLHIPHHSWQHLIPSTGKASGCSKPSSGLHTRSHTPYHNFTGSMQSHPCQSLQTHHCTP